MAMSKSLFEAAAADPAIFAEIVTAIAGVASQNGVAVDPAAIVKAAMTNQNFCAALQQALPPAIN
jgi:hypothetical protein